MELSKNSPGKNILFLSIPLAALVAFAGCTAMSDPAFYSRETLNWQAQSEGQDQVDLFLATPLLLITAFLAYRKNRAASLLWAGTVMYLLYSYLIYCFDVHFNWLFIVYCLTLGLSFYSLLYFFYTQFKFPVVKDSDNPAARKTIAIYFLVIGSMFYFLWLSEIIPSINSNTVPESLSEVGLPTNAVHVIDLSVFLPGIVITGILLLRKKTLGYLLAPALLTFFILMDITIGYLTYMMHSRGLEADLSVTFIMGLLTIVSLAFLIWYLIRAQFISANSK